MKILSDVYNVSHSDISFGDHLDPALGSVFSGSLQLMYIMYFFVSRMRIDPSFDFKKKKMAARNGLPFRVQKNKYSHLFCLYKEAPFLQLLCR